MKATLQLDRNMRLIGRNTKGQETYFDTVAQVGGDESAPSPMEIVLQSVAACSSLDVISILRKKKKEVAAYNVELEATRAEDHPKVFTNIKVKYILTSPDAELTDLERAIELSEEKYCSVSAMLNRSGCIISHEAQIIRP